MKILCPVCKEELIKEEKRYVCANRHSFDIAKQGYLNLNLKSSVKTGDEKEMVIARKEFLDKGYYSFLRDKINEVIDSLNLNNLLDLGCGEGYYTSSFKVKDKIGIDLSKETLKLASREDKSTQYILKTIFDVPLADNSLDGIITIFAPISKEVKRLLKEEGYFILVKPDVYHLFELKEKVYDNPYLNEVEEIDIEGLELVKEFKIENKALLNNKEIIDLFKMTPYYHKTAIKDFNKLLNVENLTVSFCFVLDLYKKSKK
ncbi:MAG: methyltransferase domain-containing protein [Erysipelotrichaceae bacterium]|nr:methyltransferase domain-containing protein [Erysipelotrichaceae bacterium]